MNNDRFAVDSLRLHLTVLNFYLMSVIRKEKLEQYNYCVDQSELLTTLPTDFMSSVWNFFR